jgi:hypothetical protein
MKSENKKRVVGLDPHNQPVGHLEGTMNLAIRGRCPPHRQPSISLRYFPEGKV